MNGDSEHGSSDSDPLGSGQDSSDAASSHPSREPSPNDDDASANSPPSEHAGDDIDDDDDVGSDSCLTTGKRICFIVCALLVFLAMTAVIVLQLYSDEYSQWIKADQGAFTVSPSDSHRAFDLLTLDNGLEVLLISDPTTDKSAAAIDLGIGSSSDPNDAMGLAHFHEHMLFLGSASFPTLDSFTSYVAMRGGRANAYTDDMHTNFFFDVSPEHLSGALEIFSRFFIDALLTKSSMSDEVQNVDNEYRKDLPAQGWRDYRMLEFSANPSNPFHHFTVGSLHTLKRDAAHAEEVYRKMVAFHQKWVVAQNMKLVIYGKEDLSTLAAMAKKRFGPVKSNPKLKKPKYDAKGIAYRRGHETGKMYYIETISRQKQLRYVWGLPGLGLHDRYREPVLQLINAHLLASAANGTLYDVLNTKLLLVETMQSEVFYDEKEWSGISITFELTSTGAKHIHLLSEYLFKYLRLLLAAAQNDGPKGLGGVFKLYFAESKCMDALYFKYYSLMKANPYSVVSGLAKRMQYRKKEDLLYQSLNVAPSRLQFNQTSVIEVLSHLADPKNVIVHYTNDRFETQNFDSTEPFFDIKFHREDIPKGLLTKWAQMDPFAENDGLHTLALPPLNPYILDAKKQNECRANSVTLIKDSVCRRQWKDSTDSKGAKFKAADVSPELVIDEASMRVWYLADCVLHSPRININVMLLSPLVYDTPMNAVLAEIWLQFVDFFSTEWSAEVAAASYSFALSLNHQGLVLSISGLDGRHFERLITEYLSTFVVHSKQRILNNPTLSRKVLSTILLSLRKTYQNLDFKSVWQQASFALYDIVKNPHFSRALMLDLVEGQLASPLDTLLAEVIEYIDDVLATGFVIEALFHGNLVKREAVDWSAALRMSGINLKQHFSRSAKFGDHLQQMQHLKLEMTVDGVEHRHFVFSGSNSNSADTNDVVQVYFQFGSNSGSEERYRETCLVLLLARMMKAQAFKVLRTEEALGYVATVFSKSAIGATNNINYLALMVASGTKSAAVLDERVFAFVRGHFLQRVLLPMKAETFALFVNGTRDALQQKYLRLSQKTALLWDEVVAHTYAWHWKRRYAKILEGLKLQDVIRFYRERIVGEKAKWISIQLFHQKQKGKVHKKHAHEQQYHRIVARQSEDKDVLYFNQTKDLQNLEPYARYFDVY